MSARTGSMLLTLLLAGCSQFEHAWQQPQCCNGKCRVADQESLKPAPTAALPPAPTPGPALTLKPELRAPCRIALHLTPNTSGDWKWDAKDRAVLESMAKTLLDEGLASDVFFLPTMLTGKGEMEDLRKAAINISADALFVVAGTAHIEKVTDSAPMTAKGAVNGLVVGGSVRDAMFTTEGCLFDPSSSHVFAAVQAECEAKIRPAFLVEEKDGKCVFADRREGPDGKPGTLSVVEEKEAIARAKSQALENLRGELLTRVRRCMVKEKITLHKAPVTNYLPQAQTQPQQQQQQQQQPQRNMTGGTGVTGGPITSARWYGDR